MNMKNYITKYLFVCVIMFVASCNVTDLEPVNVISESAAFATATNVESSMVGLYDTAQSGFYGGNEVNDRGYIFGAAHIQQGDMRGEDFVLINVFYDGTYRSTVTSGSANQVNYWENGFRIINIANLVIEGVEGAVEAGIITPEAGNAYLGEARTIRAMTYHTMIIHFARPFLDGAGSAPGLPIFTKGVNAPDETEEVLTIGRGTVAEVYQFILDDLTFAETNLPATRDGNKKVTRATKGAAIALKTRVYLHMGQWANVISEGNKIVSASAPFTSPIGGYLLGASVETPWANNVSSESIFSMEMSSTDNLNTNAALARMLGTPLLDGKANARGEYAISPVIWNQTFWHPDDLRRTLLVRDNGSRYFTHKYRDYTNWTDFPPIIRYAEVLLNIAEAESRTTALSPRALTLMNAIRDRAKSGAMTSYVMGDFTTGTALTQAILNERRIELLGEGERWSDIHRNAVDPNFNIGGIPAKMNAADVTSFAAYSIGATPVKAINAIPYSDYRFLWPIPQSETTRNPTLAAQQNPGY
jgi:starch-binding outer membrane protein, SusD/RagB family